MMDREYVLKAFSKEESNDVIKIYEKMKIASERGFNTFTNSFYPPNIWSFFVENYNSKILKVEASGFFEESERRIIAFNNIYGINYPFVVLEIINNSKFTNLSHRDYLGAILSLGIEREKLGDIKVDKDRAFVPVIEDIWNYIYINLSNIGKAPVEVKILEDYKKVPSTNFKEEILIVSSLRIDNFVSKLAKVSRGKAIELIDSGKILVNYSKSTDKSQDIKSGFRITIRGTGKFIIGDIVGGTRSGKQRVIIKKYT
ncbi:YlmH/Sll1252 family protein [Clostridium chauvoei]|uniref:RNA-binding protein n=2 Tax=Clostridium chauvoei TaxID=46867 RepID=A0ABD4REH9_9CLOT|nr:YlmH/Sll1252 family protein [Clostridium chauvoei]ATD55217.1 RNA-binding protein [Clostridium chauvoei]ATD57111.1 RNA-binding protein [Clostridium chauvoei]MBX7279561.1 RNA-binding protein [Clostridium chauvoei]MBX7281930.1 RNA-binding protein [Clostridium chauvoei]MBX7284481.1 RNA-binding protein [Clostridium chauvoei]